MKKIHVVVEGVTEETFVREVLAPHLEQQDVFITPSLITTRRQRSGQKHGGGISSYGKLKNDLHNILRDSSLDFVTTMIDYYGLPTDFPNAEIIGPSTCYDRVERLEERFAADIGHQRFLPFITLHEFEGLLFSDPAAIANAFPDATPTLRRELERIREGCGSPEEINDGSDTHPAQRLLQRVPGYRKGFHGSLIAGRIGLDQIRQQCPHFNRWVEKLES